ncbi:MAG TPA: GAF domain-containing protein, partial [Chloroflexota bacterium]|nr:GAF domain-containing protein [Chloroflexota bacterium]
MAVQPYAHGDTAHQVAEHTTEASHLSQLQALHALSDAVGCAQTLEAIYEHALDCLFRTLAVDRASILIADSNGVMRFRAWRDLSDDYRRFADGHSPWAPDHPNPQPVLVPDVSTDPSLETLRDRILGEGIRALAFIPLLSRGVLLGKFMLYYNQPHTFTTAEIELSRTVAQYVSFAIERKLTENALRESRDQLNVILQGVADGITVQKANGALLFANDASARFCGYPDAEALIAAPVSEVLERFEIADEAGRPVSVDQLPGRQALRGTHAPEVVLRYRARQTGEERWSVVRSVPILDESGQVRLAVNILHDFTAHKAAQERQRFLAAATDVLAGSLDLETTLQQVAHLAVPRLADWCAVSLLEAGGILRRVAAAHADPAKESIVRELQQRYPDDLVGRPELMEIVETRQPKLYRNVSPEVYQR